MTEKKEDKLKEFRCRRCKSGTIYVKQGNENYKIRVCRRCGFEEKIYMHKIQKEKK